MKIILTSPILLSRPTKCGCCGKLWSFIPETARVNSGGAAFECDCRTEGDQSTMVVSLDRFVTALETEKDLEVA